MVCVRSPLCSSSRASPATPRSVTAGPLVLRASSAQTVAQRQTSGSSRNANQALKIMTLFRRTARGFCPRPPPRVSRNVNAQAGISAGEVEIDRRDAERESDEGGGGCSKVTHNVLEGDWSYLSTGRL